MTEILSQFVVCDVFCDDAFCGLGQITSITSCEIAILRYVTLVNVWCYSYTLVL